MSLGYDIFRRLADGSPLWMGQAATLTEAKEKIMALDQTIPANYFVRDANTGAVIEDASKQNASTLNAPLQNSGN